MIWRESYSTKIVYGPAPAVGPFFDLEGTPAELPDGAVIGGPMSLWTEIEAWRKLVAEHLPTLLVLNCTAEDRDLIDVLVPGSLKAQVLTTEHDLDWRGDRAVAVVQRQGSWPIAMIGPATEEALEQFLSEL